eukprot:gene17959-biopygen9914
MNPFPVNLTVLGTQRWSSHGIGVTAREGTDAYGAPVAAATAQSVVSAAGVAAADAGGVLWLAPLVRAAAGARYCPAWIRMLCLSGV